MNKKVESENYFVDGMPNEEYHEPELGVSSSVLKLFLEDPSLVVWNSTAKRDPTKTAAVDFGRDFHTYHLEPAAFKESHQVLPVYNRRKPAEKQAELDLIEKWKEKGIIATKADDLAQIEAMRQSMLAHPTVELIESMSGVNERSYFWIDPKTGLKCKCRPDRFVEGITPENMPAFMATDPYLSTCNALSVDYKTCDDIGRIQSDIESYGYYIQDQFYTRGIECVTGLKVAFVFVFVSKKLSIGRYPVRVVVLTDAAKFNGAEKIDAALERYAAMAKGPKLGWCTAQSMDRPQWAVRAEEANEMEWAS